MPSSILSLAFTFLLLAPLTAQGQSAENVAVVINELSADSRRIGEHYAQARRIPDVNVFRIEAPLEEEIDRNAFDTTIEQPLATAIKRAGLQDRLLYLVLTKGVPLRVKGTSGLDGTQTSVDSELTLLYPATKVNPSSWPAMSRILYFLGAREIDAVRPFSHRDHDIYLVTRIDAFTVDEALALVERAQAPTADGRVVLDQRAGAASQQGDEWMARAAARSRPKVTRTGCCWTRRPQRRGTSTACSAATLGARQIPNNELDELA